MRCTACVALLVSEGATDAAAAARDATIALGDRVLLDGRDVTDAIRTPAVVGRRVAGQRGPRRCGRRSSRKQRELLADGGDWVAEGRDIGTVVCPDAPVKVFLTASPEERARRRADELGADFAAVLAEQRERDARDREREHSPLVAAADAVPVDTTGMDLDGVIEQIVTLVVEQREVEA